MRALFAIVSFVVLVSCSSQEKVRHSADWRKDSEKLGRAYANSIGAHFPEYVSGMGFTRFDSGTTPYSKDFENQRYAHAWQWKKKLEKFLEVEKNVELRTDAIILLDQVNLEMEEIEMSRSMGIVPFVPLTEFIHNNLQELLPKGASKPKINSAMARFRTYVRGGDKVLPLSDGVLAYTLNRLNHLEEKRMKGFWPTRSEIETYLKESDDFLAGIEGLLKEVWPGDEWKRDLNELKIQDQIYREFLKKKILPYCRKDNLTPYRIYSFMLKGYGIYAEPDDLIETSHRDYKKTYERFSGLAKELAKIHSLERNDPLSVVEYFHAKKPLTDEDLFKIYQNASNQLFHIVKDNDLLTLQKRPNVVIRFATTAESRSMPSPQFIAPPFIGKDKTPGQFVIPRTTSEKGMDDFSYEGAILNLTAHEAIPGHALQYQVMKERGTTLIRSNFAFNSANVEGWGHYAEEIVYPYLSKEAQFITLQRRLWRVARMYLDPELNLGKIRPEKVLDTYTKELGFSKEFAAAELKRYSILSPAQAPSYYYGYKILSDLKANVLKGIDPKVGEKCFNDAVLNLGVLPLKEINARLRKSLDCEGSR